VETRYREQATSQQWFPWKGQLYLGAEEGTIRPLPDFRPCPQRAKRTWGVRGGVILKQTKARVVIAVIGERITGFQRWECCRKESMTMGPSRGR
jgi:hypothetical protein